MRPGRRLGLGSEAAVELHAQDDFVQPLQVRNGEGLVQQRRRQRSCFKKVLHTEMLSILRRKVPEGT